MAFEDMTVLARTKTGAGRIRRHREGRLGRVAERRDDPNPAQNPTPDELTNAARREREAGVSEDHAVYTCQCGLVFEALVSTSVDCPHCGGAQAW
jgi:hypothetical protein